MTLSTGPFEEEARIRVIKRHLVAEKQSTGTDDRCWTMGRVAINITPLVYEWNMEKEVNKPLDTA